MYTYFFKCEDSLFPLKHAEANEADGSQSGMILGIAEVLVTKPVLQIYICKLMFGSLD